MPHSARDCRILIYVVTGSGLIYSDAIHFSSSIWSPFLVFMSDFISNLIREFKGIYDSSILVVKLQPIIFANISVEYHGTIGRVSDILYK